MPPSFPEKASESLLLTRPFHYHTDFSQLLYEGDGAGFLALSFHI